MKILVAAPTEGGLLLGTLAYTPHPDVIENRAVPRPTLSVDLNRYIGRSYERFHYEASFESGMEDITAEYSLKDNGHGRQSQTETR
jgi:lipocalin